MSYIGDIALSKTFDTKFTTVTTTGAPTVLAGSPVISAYVDNNTTQITAGITLSVDFDGVVGLNNIRVVATSGNGYAAGGNYQLVITTGTVGGTSVVGYVVAEFSIEARSSLRPTTADRTLDVSAGGEAGMDWANIGSPTTAQNLSATNIDVDQIVASVSGAVGSVTGHTPQTGDSFARIGANGASLTSLATQASVNTIDDFLDTEIAAIITTLGAAGAGLTALGDARIANLDATISSRASQASLDTVDNLIDTEIADIQARLPAALVAGRIDASVGAMAAGVVTAAAVATDAIDSDAMSANAITEIQNGLATSAALALVSAFIDTEVTTLQADVTAILADTGTDGVVVVAASKTGYALSAAGVDEIFDELRAGHSVVGSYGESFKTIVSGAAIAGTLSTTQMSTNLTEATNDHYNGRVIIWTTGALADQATDITAYNGTTKVLTYTATTEAPAAGDKFIIV